ncbi:MAG: ATP-binding protein [Pseudomonadota bacterium]
MFDGWFLLLFIYGYLSLLFLVAYYAERRGKKGKSLVTNPYVYSLSLAVYCTSWTFYGSVGEAATSGLSFLPIYLGPTLMVPLWGIFLIKILRIAKENRITTISDLIGSRYGNSLFLSALVTIVTLVGITPYLGLQMKAIMNTFTILAGKISGSLAAGWIITIILGIFAIIFGARKLDASERHEGLVFAIAFESIVKLVAFLVVGFFVTYFLFNGFQDIFTRTQNSPYRYLLSVGAGTSVNYAEWASLLFLSMMAIIFLPRQFHMTVVENSDLSHISKAMWLFPLYLFLINIFVMPIAFGGILLGGSQLEADSFVLSIPLSKGKSLLVLLVFIGGFSAATSMLIVESLALSTMVMNSLVMPAIFRYNHIKSFPTLILNIKRGIIIGCILLGYFFAVFIGRFYTLVEIGLKSFAAVTIFAPAVFLGLFWKRGNKNGAIGAILVGFVIWFYTLLMPALVKAEVLPDSGLMKYLMNSELLNPRALFGLRGLDKWTHFLFWEFLLNTFTYLALSLFTAQKQEEEKQALLFVESYSPRMLALKTHYSIQQVEDILGQYIGRGEAKTIVDRFLTRERINRTTISEHDLTRLRDEAERVLSGALGSSIATIIFEDKLTLTEQERGELSDSIKQITNTLRLSRHELAEANRDLATLKEFSENIIESAPVGIVTIDPHSRVKYWNREMETITGIKKEVAINRHIHPLLPWITRKAWQEEQTDEMVVQTPTRQTIKINISPFKDPSGGLVAILENITEKKKMEEQLLQTSKLASLGKLTAGISHEIGNPLASISSLVQELQSFKMETPEEIDFTVDSVNTINNHIERIAKVVRSLGDFARISASEKTMVNVAEILDRTFNLVKYDKRFKNIDYVTDIEEVLPIKINQDQLQQVFLNLLLNSGDAMPEGGRLEVSIKGFDTSVEIRFSDTGQGMDEAVINRIFDPFFTTKPMGRGTGLGLSICYGIIKDHNGTIQVKSKKEIGTTFTIRLPREEYYG